MESDTPYTDFVPLNEPFIDVLDTSFLMYDNSIIMETKDVEFMTWGNNLQQTNKLVFKGELKMAGIQIGIRSNVQFDIVWRRMNPIDILRFGNFMHMKGFGFVDTIDTIATVPPRFNLRKRLDSCDRFDIKIYYQVSIVINTFEIK